VREKVSIDHRLAVAMRSRNEWITHCQRLLGSCRDRPCGQALVKVDAEALRLSGRIKPRAVCQFKDKLFPSRLYRHIDSYRMYWYGAGGI
jgi:hypothetical protein